MPKSQNACWECQKPTKGFVYHLRWGKPNGWDQLGYFCTRECLSEYICEHWEEM